MANLEEYNPKEKDFNIAIYGENGSGKSHLACTAPGNKIFIDYHGNLSIVQKFPNEPIKCVRGPEKWNDMQAMWSDPIFDWADVVILDNVTGLYRILVEDVVATIPLKNENRPTKECPILRDYGLAAERLRHMIGNGFVKKLHKERKKLIIAVMHTKVDTNEDGAVVSGGPALPGQVPSYFVSLFPEFMYLFQEGTKRAARLGKKGLFGGCTRILDPSKEYENPTIPALYPGWGKN